MYSKQQIIKSKKFAKYRDLLNAILDDKKQYSVEEIDKMISDFMKGKVK